VDPSREFYSTLFGWPMHTISPEVTGAVAQAGPTVSLRSGMPDGFPGVVPFIGVADVEAALERVVAAGGQVERSPWTVPMVGKLARFKDPAGTIYGLTSGLPPVDIPRLPAPFGTNPKPPVGTICALEMYVADAAASTRFFGDLFGWGTRETMPKYLGFDPGAGIGGTFQLHTPSLPAVAYIYVADVGAKLDEVEAAGGHRLGEPMHVPGAATFGYFKDVSGTIMGLIGP
jgi:predicted enzyme related to lactoylglutathione lyase